MTAKNSEGDHPQNVTASIILQVDSLPSSWPGICRERVLGNKNAAGTSDSNIFLTIDERPGAASTGKKLQIRPFNSKYGTSRSAQCIARTWRMLRERSRPSHTRASMTILATVTGIEMYLSFINGTQICTFMRARMSPARQNLKQHCSLDQSLDERLSARPTDGGSEPRDNATNSTLRIHFGLSISSRTGCNILMARVAAFSRNEHQTLRENKARYGHERGQNIFKFFSWTD